MERFNIVTIGTPRHVVKFVLSDMVIKEAKPKDVFVEENGVYAFLVAHTNQEVLEPVVNEDTLESMTYRGRVIDIILNDEFPENGYFILDCSGYHRARKEKVFFKHVLDIEPEWWKFSLDNPKLLTCHKGVYTVDANKIEQCVIHKCMEE